MFLSPIVRVVMWLLLLPAVLPLTTYAEDPFPGIVSFAGCSGTDCSACNVVYMVNEGISWLIGILFVIFAVLIAVRGVQMVTSGGNPGSLSAVKESFTNAFIGIIIILSAWLLVDTIMRGLVGAPGHEGEIKVVQGSVTGWLAWSEVECQVQETPVFEEVHVIEQSADTCTVVGTTYGGDPIFDCAAQMAACASRGGTGTINTSSAVNHRVECSVTSGAGLTGTTYTLATPSGPVPVTSCDEASLTTIPFLGRRVTVHRNVAPSLGRVNAQWQAAGGNSFYSIREMGSYSCRDNVNAPGTKSWHSYGLAIDINQGANPNTSKQTPCPSDMPPEFVAMLRAEGWGWGGNWNSRCDAMHFSKGLNEGGNMAGD